MTLNPEQETKVREMFAWFPYRIVFVATKQGEEDVISAVMSKRIPNKLARDGWNVFIISASGE